MRKIRKTLAKMILSLYQRENNKAMDQLSEMLFTIFIYLLVAGVFVGAVAWAMEILGL